MDASGAIQYLHTDNIGSVRLITNSAREVVGASDYTPYGAVAAHTGTSVSNFGFATAWADSDTKMNYLRARDYDPATGQFVQVDPVVDATHQPYAYVAGDPLASIDPSGLCPGSSTNPGPGFCTPEDFGANSPLLTPLGNAIVRFKFGDWLAEVLTQGATGEAANFAVGVGDGATGGITQIIRNLMSPNVECFVNKDGWYYGGVATGTLAVTIATAGIGSSAAAAGAGARALPEVSSVANLIRAAKPVGSALKSDSWHRSSAWVLDEIAESGSVFRTTGGDGVARILVQTPGEVNGILGRFEWILDGETLTHQMFVRGGTISGVPIKP